MMRDGRMVTGGEDGKVAIWVPGRSEPVQTFVGHTAPVASLAVSPDGKRIASASWDRTVRVWPVDGGEATVLEGHKQNVNGLAFMPDGRALVSASYDPEIRIWRFGSSAPIVTTVLTPLNAVVVASDGEIIAAGGDGKVYFFSSAGEAKGAIVASPTPII
jgi:cytochrome c